MAKLSTAVNSSIDTVTNVLGTVDRVANLLNTGIDVLQTRLEIEAEFIENSKDKRLEQKMADFEIEIVKSNAERELYLLQHEEKIKRLKKRIKAV